MSSSINKNKCKCLLYYEKCTQMLPPVIFIFQIQSFKLYKAKNEKQYNSLK